MLKWRIRCRENRVYKVYFEIHIRCQSWNRGNGKCIECRGCYSSEQVTWLICKLVVFTWKWKLVVTWMPEKMPLSGNVFLLLLWDRLSVIILMKGTVPKRLDICYDFGTFSNILNFYFLIILPMLLDCGIQ